RPWTSGLVPSATLSRSPLGGGPLRFGLLSHPLASLAPCGGAMEQVKHRFSTLSSDALVAPGETGWPGTKKPAEAGWEGYGRRIRSEEHTSELQSREDLV